MNDAMKLYFMKQDAVDFIKHNIDRLYTHYFQDETNEWIEKEYGSNPFVEFIEVPDFELADVESMSVGEADFENCKILYNNLRMLSESQCSDERLWAGLCNGNFYDYLRHRYQYPVKKLNKKETDASAIISRFFFSGGSRSGAYRNGLAKCWWIGHATFEKDNPNHFEYLDIIGANDLTTKISDIFYSNTFSANRTIMAGICDALKFFKDNGQVLDEKLHIRGAMKYLNAVGGAILLDALTREEICKLLKAWIISAIKGDDNVFNVLDDEEQLLEEIEEDELYDVAEDDEIEVETSDYNFSGTQITFDTLELEGRDEGVKENSEIGSKLQAIYEDFEEELKKETEKEEKKKQIRKLELENMNRSDYIGENVRHIYSGEGVIESIDDKYIEIRYKETGKLAKYPLSVCCGDKPLIFLM